MFSHTWDMACLVELLPGKVRFTRRDTEHEHQVLLKHLLWICVFSVCRLLGDGDAGRGRVYNPGSPTAHGSWQRPKVHAPRRQPNHRHGPGHRNPPHDRERQVQLGLRDRVREGNSWCMKPLWTEVLEIALDLNYGPLLQNQMLRRMTMLLLVMSSQALKICAQQFSTWGKKSIARMSNQTLSWDYLCRNMLYFYYPRFIIWAVHKEKNSSFVI